MGLGRLAATGRGPFASPASASLQAGRKGCRFPPAGTQPGPIAACTLPMPWWWCKPGGSGGAGANRKGLGDMRTAGRAPDSQVAPLEEPGHPKTVLVEGGGS